jgi:hypothetical protein
MLAGGQLDQITETLGETTTWHALQPPNSAPRKQAARRIALKSINPM